MRINHDLHNAANNSPDIPVVDAFASNISIAFFAGKSYDITYLTNCINYIYIYTK